MGFVVAPRDAGVGGEHVEAVVGGDAMPLAVVERLDPAEEQEVAGPDQRGEAPPRGRLERQEIGRRRLGPADQPGRGARPPGQGREPPEILRLIARVPFVRLADIGLDDAQERSSFRSPAPAGMKAAATIRAAMTAPQSTPPSQEEERAAGDVVTAASP